MAQAAPRPKRHQSIKPRHTYRELDSESDLDFERLSTRSLPTRSSRRVETYREQTSTDDENDGGVLSSSEPDSDSLPGSQLPAPPRRTGIRARTTVRRSQRSKGRNSNQNHKGSPSTWNTFKRQKLSQPNPILNKMQKTSVDQIAETPINVHAPPWQTLEYSILIKILQHAIYTPHKTSAHSLPPLDWLIEISKLCKSFHSAAAAVMLWEPPLLPVHRAHKLISLLSQDQSKMTLNYRTKIRSLNVEVKHLLVRKSGIDITELLSCVPQLTHLRLFHWHDNMVGKAIWAEPVVGRFKWLYGNLFDLLDGFNIRLKSFEWNGRFQDTLSAMPLAHQRSCLSNLQSVTIVNMSFTDKQENERQDARDKIFTALALLPSLKHVAFSNCTVIDTTAMTRLPLGLSSVRIVNCLSLTSGGIGSYLAISGSSVRDLHLEGNQVMDLAFMPKLAAYCPSLENLYIDLSYEDSSSYHDRNPLYDELLPEGGPTWPPSLRSIIVGPLRSLDISDAEEFYESLLAAADNLPFLRVLSIKTILNDAGWRDRANLRKKWRPIFEKVFAVKKTTPQKSTKSGGSLKQVRSEKAKTRAKASQRKSARLQELEDVSISEDVDDYVESLPSDPNLPRQNRCEVVEFELSDQRPAQEQFREADFLDSEPSGDDEWNG